MIASVAVVGCGWFGLPLAKALVKHGYKVSGSKRSEQDAEALNNEGIAGFALDLDCDERSLVSQEAIASGLATDAIVINVPPGLRRGDDAYLTRLARLKALMGKHTYQRIIFISTTGVYAPGSVCTEHDAAAFNAVSETLLAAEGMFSGDNCTVLRFAGLIGPKRHPGRFLAGRQNVSGGNLAVNLVHLDDCVGAVLALLEHSGSLSPAYNLSASKHPTKAEFYTLAATQLGLESPSFVDAMQSDDKIVDGGLITRELNYLYHHDDPLKMLAHCD
ncbi:SDR family oxidoreductase [Shewanella sp.]|uniref:SDR family oxidoreductase n=1 Tax=Shewanella sp. TaxID=50422 RepID=UPI003D109B2F